MERDERRRILCGGRLRRTKLVLWAALVAALGLPWAERAQSEAPSLGLVGGSRMLDFGLRRLDLGTGKLGALVWLSDFVGREAGEPSKRLLLLNFFAAWCEPCFSELPVLEQLQTKYGARGLQVVSVYQRREGESFEDAIARTRQRLRGRSLPFPLLFDRYTNRNQQLYLGARAALPCNLLIGSDGVVRLRLQGGRAAGDGTLEREVERLLEVAP